MRDNLTAVAAALAIGAASFGAHASDVKVGGKMYMDLTDKTDKVGGNKTDATGYGVDVPRFYLSVDGKLDDVWSMNFTTDFKYSSSDGKSQPFVKKAYVQAKLDPLFVLRAGSADMPWIPFVEGVYGFRYVEPTTTDRLGLGNSADWGLHAGGSDSMFDYAVSIVNGAGYSNVSSRSKRMDFEGRADVKPFDGLTLAAGFYNGKLGQDHEVTAADNTASRYDGLISYVGNGLRFGGEYFSAKNFSKTAVLSGPEDKADGYSFWASYDITDIITVFGRYDDAKPSKDLAPNVKVKYYNAGVQYVAAKGISLALAYKGNKTDTGSSATDKKTDEVGIFGEFKF
ncbi:porin [Solimonas terrae]|uniref:Carbohydrate porin n=1 Tax=Solimonas terrae TaxID=1396819 RepID=A0A6M2BUP5_9GAMM|nr:porin [Solimonas terrae]NGY06104.1 carbohydrate porin [Solimonas terrae]